MTERIQWTHPKDQFDSYSPLPLDGIRFSPTSFDWDWDADEEALPTEATATDFSKQCSENSPSDIPSLRPSNDAILRCPIGSSFTGAGEVAQPLTMQRNYPSFYSEQLPLTTSLAHHDFAAVQQPACNTLNDANVEDISLLPSNGADSTIPMLQAKADHAVNQQQLPVREADSSTLNAEAVTLSSVNVAPSHPPNRNLACGSPSIGFLYDEQYQMQLDEKMQGPQFGCQLKEDVDFDTQNQMHCGVITSGTESNTGHDFIGDHPKRLSVPSDEQFLDPVYSFLRFSCIEVFVCGSEHNSGRRGRKVKGQKEGQVGLRCAHCKDIPRSNRANQAVSYPSKTAHIFESVRNFQRTHLEACEYIPHELKVKHRELVSQTGRKVQLKYVKVYFAEAAREIGIVETLDGLFFGAPPNTSGKPSEKLQAIMSIAENPSASKDRKLHDLLFPKVDERVENSKFSHIASATTRQVIARCRQEKTAFVYPSDYPTLSDFRFVLFHQFVPCRPPTSALTGRKTKPEKWETLSGLWCKHCAKSNAYELSSQQGQGKCFPLDLESLHDTSFLNNLTCHIITCRFVPLETKEALNELQRLAAEHGVVTKRGAKRFFLEKLWGRMANYYAYTAPKREGCS